MDIIEYRAVIKFFVKEGLTPNEIHSDVVFFNHSRILTTRDNNSEST
jgi:hypothetical protein